MGKIKKRSLSQENQADKQQNSTQSTATQQKLNKKKKIDNTSNSQGKAVQKPETISNGTGATVTDKKKNKKKEQKKQKLNQTPEQKASKKASVQVKDNKSAKANNSNLKDESKDNSATDALKAAKSLEIKNKRKELKLQRRQLARERRKENRAVNGTYQVNTFTADDIKAKIANIESRDTLTKTSKRKLAILKRRLRALESGETVTKRVQVVTANAKTEGKEKEQKQAKKPTEKAKELQVNVKNTDKVKPTKKAPAVVKTEKLDKPIKIKQTENLQSKKLAKGQKKLQNQLLPSVKIDAKSDDEEEEEEEDVNESEDEDEQGEDDFSKGFKVEQSMEEDDDDDDDEDEDEDEDDDDDADSNVDENEDDADANVDEDEDEDDDDDDDDDGQGSDNDDNDTNEKEDKNYVKAKTEVAKKQVHQGENSNKRYVLFVGNLPYSVKPEEVKKHFLTKVSAVTSVRVPTRRGTNKPLGIAYVEFANSSDFEKGLSLHNTFIDGRKINVQYTTTGSKHISKKPEVVAKNQKLHALRKMGKLAGSGPNKKFTKKNKKP